MFCMCIDRGYVGKGESNLCFVCVFSGGVLYRGE